jgi:hypothetical protein
VVEERNEMERENTCSDDITAGGIRARDSAEVNPT